MTQPLRRAGHAPVALEAGADERLVGQVGTGEQVRRSARGTGSPTSVPAVDRRLYDRPLDPVGERGRGGVAIGRGRRATSGPRRSSPGGVPRRRRARSRTRARGARRGRRAPGPAGAAAAGVRHRPPRPAAGRGGAGGPPGRGRRGSRRAARRTVTGSPRSLRTSTAASRTARWASCAENGALTMRSGGANSRSAGARSGSPAPPGSGDEDDVGARARPAGDGARPGRDELDDAAAARARPRAAAPPTTPVARRDPAEHRRDEALRARRPRAGTRSARPSRGRLDAPEAPGDRRGLPAPRRADGRPEQRLEGSVAAASRPSTHAVPWYCHASRSAIGRSGGIPRRGGSAAGLPPRARCSASSSSAADRRRRRRLEDGGRRALDEAPEVVAEARRHRPHAPLSSRWTKPRTIRTPSSNASHGLRSRHCAAAGRLDVAVGDPHRGEARPGAVASRLAGASAWRSARRSAASIGAARRSSSIRSRIAPNADSWRGVWRSSSSRAGPSPPSRTGNRSRERAADLEALGSSARRDVLRVERRLALLAAAELVAADRAAVVLADRPRPGGPPSSWRSAAQVSSSRTTGRSQVAQRLA